MNLKFFRVPVLLLLIPLGFLSIGNLPRLKADMGSGFGTERRVNAASSALHAEPTIAVNPANPYNLVAVYMDVGNSADTHYCVSYLSSDGGNSWGSRYVASPPPQFASNTLCDDPVVRYASNGVPYLVYLLDWCSSLGCVWSEQWWVYVNYSPDQGVDWAGLPGAGVVAATDDSCHSFVDKPWLAIDSANNMIYVAFMEADISGSDCGTVSFRIRLASAPIYSPWGNHLTGWSIVDVTSSTDPLNGANIVVAPNGDVLVAWYDHVSGDLYSGRMAEVFASSTDHGNSFSSPITIATAYETSETLCSYWRVYGTMHPKLAIETTSYPSSYTLYVVYGARPQSGTANCNADISDIYFSRSSDDGNTWSNAYDLTPGGSGGNPDQFFPSIAVDSDHVLHVTYADMGVDTTQNNRYQTMHRQSHDHGLTWGPPQAVASQMAFSTNSHQFIGDYFDISTSGSRVIPIWTDLRSGGTDIYTAVSLPPPSCSASASPTSGSIAVTVYFLINSCAGGSPPYSYNWQFNDGYGSSATTPAPSNTYFMGTDCVTHNGVTVCNYYPTLVVTDAAGGVAYPGLPTITVSCRSPCSMRPIR